LTRSEEERLADIVEACREVAALVARGREAFDNDRAVALAVERLLEVIGEAANALAESTRSRYPTAAWRDITRLRIVLAHHYHRVDPDQVWAIATSEVPRLMDVLEGSNDS
jgi:uncharacterized protein with HEPN domain